MGFVWLAVLVSTTLGAGVAFMTLASAGSAPQEAAGYAMAMALAVIPYIWARALEGTDRSDGAGRGKRAPKPVEPATAAKPKPKPAASKKPGVYEIP